MVIAAMRYKTIFTTERGLFHQERAIAAAPSELDVVMLRQPSPEQLMLQAADAVYFISGRSGTIDAQLIRAMPKLKLILRLGSLTYDIDLEAARAAGIIVCYQPSSASSAWPNTPSCKCWPWLKGSTKLSRSLAKRADWRESRRRDEDTFAYNWSNRQGINQPYERTVSLLGFGEIGAEMARRLVGWGCALLYHKRRRLPEAVERELGLSYAQPDELIASADYLVNLAALLARDGSRHQRPDFRQDEVGSVHHQRGQWLGHR